MALPVNSGTICEAGTYGWNVADSLGFGLGVVMCAMARDGSISTL